MNAVIKFPVLIILLGFSILAGTAGAQTKEQKKAQLKQLIESRSYVFNAQSATPLSGRLIQLTSEYFLRVNRDSLESHLPYFGVAFHAPIGSSTSPLIFTSSDFTYNMEESKKGRFEITIRLNKPDDPNILRLSVSSGGYATLGVTSRNRQSISFYGNIVPSKK